MIRLIYFLLLSANVLVHGNFQKSTPRRFYVSPTNYKNIIPGVIGSLVRLGSGAFTQGYSVSIKSDDINTKNVYAVFRGFGFRIEESSDFARGSSFTRPKKPLEIYEFEGCPFCKKVREAITILDLDVIFYPCPRGGPTFRTKVKKIGGKAQFPYLVDPNTKFSTYESDDIIAYLFSTYGNGVVPWTLTPRMSTTLSASLSLVPRLGKGSRYEEAKSPKVPLIFWGYEASPFTKVVRERLNELEIPHLMKTVGRGSPKRQELFDKKGFFQVPYLEDPNTGAKLFESLDIIEYLSSTYSAVASIQSRPSVKSLKK